MKTMIPDELASLYGTMAISRIMTARTKAVRAQMPEVEKALRKAREEGRKPAAKSLPPLDVENGGMGDEFEEFMTDGFEKLIPDFTELTPGKLWPIPTIPDEVKNCARILRALRDAREEQRAQQEAAARLQALVDGLGKSAHPILALFTALFKAGLKEVEDRLTELEEEIAWLVDQAISNDCDIAVPY